MAGYRIPNELHGNLFVAFFAFQIRGQSSSQECFDYRNTDFMVSDSKMSVPLLHRGSLPVLLFIVRG